MSVDPIKLVSRIFMTIAPTNTLGALLLIAEKPCYLRELVNPMGFKSAAQARRQASRLASAGLITLRPAGKNSYLFCEVSRMVEVREDDIRIDAGGLPITIGRYLNGGGVE